MTISSQLKAAVQERVDRGETIYRIAKDAGISAPVLRRFMSGERSLQLTTVDRLADHLGLSLRGSKSSSRRREA